MFPWFIGQAVRDLLDDASGTVFAAFVRARGGARPRHVDMYEAIFVRDDVAQAAATGNLPLLEWFASFDRILEYYPISKSLTEAAARHGHLEVLQWAVNNGAGMWNDTHIELAASNGHLHVLEWFGETDRIRRFYRREGVCVAAAENGHLDALRWLRRPGASFAWDELACARAAANGHLEVLQWARANGCPWGAGQLVIREAAANGRLDILQWARAQGCAWHKDACESAADGGHLEVLKWAIANGCPQDTDLCYAASRGGHLDVVVWARENGYGFPWDKWTVVHAVFSGNVELVEWVVANGCPRVDLVRTSFACGAARRGHLSVLRWLVHRGARINEDTFAAAAEGGSLDACRLLLDAGCPWDWRLGDRAAEHGWVEVLRWALANGYEWHDGIWRAAAYHRQRHVLAWAHRRGIAAPADLIPAAGADADEADDLFNWVRRNIGG
jgi:hypothetical protein